MIILRTININGEINIRRNEINKNQNVPIKLIFQSESYFVEDPLRRKELQAFLSAELFNLRIIDPHSTDLNIEAIEDAMIFYEDPTFSKLVFVNEVGECLKDINVMMISSSI